MAASKSTSKRVLCTAGRGMEVFVAQEAVNRCHGYDVESHQGKVAFSSDVPPNRLLGVKSAERLMILVSLQKPPVKIIEGKRRQKSGFSMASHLADFIVTDNACMWRSSVSTWKEFQKPFCFVPAVNESSQPPAKRIKASTESYPSSNCKVDCLSFRVSCKCAGRLGRQISSQDLAKAIGIRLGTLMSWEVDLKSPDLELCVHVNDDLIVTALPTTRLPLSNRPYLKTFGLRSTVAWVMGRLAEIEPGHVVLDPMCGAGVLLVEAAREWQDAVYVGCDLSGGQLSRAIENVQKAATFGIFLMEGDGTALPLADASVDAVICDLPFGQQHSFPENIGKLYTSFACEMNRVIRKDGKLVLLTSTANMDVLSQAFKNGSAALTFCVTATHPVALGILPACIVVLKRNVSY